MNFIVCLAFLLVAVSATSVDEQDWEFYKQKFNKKYSSPREHHYRKGIFLKNRDEILSHNERFEAGLATHKAGVNQFTDMSKEEFASYASGIKVPGNIDTVNSRNEMESKTLEVTSLPESVNWLEKGAVTEVRDQGTCGASWAFAAVGAVEGRHFLESGKLVSLSEQNLIDCDREGDNSGCEGGDPFPALQFIIEQGGVDTRESYPYIENETPYHFRQLCKFNSSTVGASIKSVSFVDRTTPNLMAALAYKGPVSVGIHIGPELMHYSGGIYTMDMWSIGTRPNHAVLLVGYGSEKNVDYWLVKNSWGTKWGEEGYIRIRRGFGYDSMITSNAVYVE